MPQRTRNRTRGRLGGDLDNEGGKEGEGVGVMRRFPGRGNYTNDTLTTTLRATTGGGGAVDGAAGDGIPPRRVPTPILHVISK